MSAIFPSFRRDSGRTTRLFAAFGHNLATNCATRAIHAELAC
jgi:hypothetical protein